MTYRARDVTQFYVGGAWVDPIGERTSDVLDPSTEDVIATAIVPDPKDAERAIEAARAAFDDGPWPKMPVAERARLVRRMGEILAERKRDIGELLMHEVGATLVLAKTAQANWAIEVFDMVAGWAEDFPWEEEVEPRTQPFTVRALARREPVGVITAMTPFNYPFFVNCWKVAPSIVMGNTMVLKPSPWTPLDAFEIARAAEEAQIPPGVVNVIGGGGIDVGQVLASHPMVDMVAFTGSVTGGRAVGAAAMQTVKKVQLELGGKSAAVVLDDADPGDVAMKMMFTCMMHAGQGCGCTTRLVVPRGLHVDVLDALKAQCEAQVLGPPTDPAVTLGPLIRDEHRARVEAYVATGLAEGARLVAGGRRPAHLDRGFFYEPTVFADVTSGMTIAQEEIFGPVLCVLTYDTIDEAIAIANDSIFGLAGAVVSNDRSRALDVARRMRTGFVEIGAVPPNYACSWGGYKQSGIGREWKMGLEEFTELKQIAWGEY